MFGVWLTRQFLLLAVVLFLCASAFAQEARLSGSISDSTGAIMMGVDVTAIQTDRNVVFQTKSITDGHYLFPRLPIGSYEVKAEMSGFKTLVQSDINLTTNADALLNIVMQVGSLAEEVTVSGSASRVSTETATVQQLVDASRVVDLPLNGRNVYQLETLAPGTGPSGTNIGGGRAGSQNSSMVNIRIDGALNVNNAYGDILPSPSPDAVQEFNIQTSVPPARYGWASGVIEISTKSGTNQLHGSLYEFLRNQDLDARSFFLPTRTQRKRNQYGFTAGGPLLIPKLYDGHNKTFWFANFEQQKESLGAAVTIFVPTAAQFRGDFSSSTRKILDPTTGQQFPNNQIPANRLDPLAMNLINKFVPAAQDATGLYTYQRPAGQNPTNFLGRGDEVLGSSHQLNGRAFVTRLTAPGSNGNLPGQFQQSVSTNNTEFISGSWVWIIAPNKINTARIGYNHEYTYLDLQPKLTDAELKSLGFAPNYYFYLPVPPDINISGYFEMSNQFSTKRNYATYTWSDDYSWVHGRHMMMFGTDTIRTIMIDRSFSRFGTYGFTGSFSGLGISDFLLGRPASYLQANPAINDTYGLHWSWYAQDDIKVSRRLTLNLGLRYELPLPPHSAKNNNIIYRPGVKSVVYKNAPLGLLFPGDPGVSQSGYDGKKKYFASRVGVSYALTRDQKTTLRTGYGIYYNPAWTNIEGQMQIYQPFIRIINLVAPPSTADPWLGYPGGNPFPYTSSANSVFDQQINTFVFSQDYRESMMQQWNLSIQREFARDWLGTVAYVGTRGTRIPYLADINPAVYIPGASTVANTNQRRPLYPDFARFSMVQSVVNSSYHSLQASLDHRLAKGLTVLAAYTFSKALDDSAENAVLTNDGGVQNPNNRMAEWAPPSFDRTHVFVASWVWNIPFGSGTRGVERVLLHGWELNGIWSASTGAPLGFTASQDRALRGQPNRPDRLADARITADRTKAQMIAQYFNTAAFAPNATGQFGSAPRADGQLAAPGQITLTVGIFKTFRGLTETHKLQFRTEIFNALNRANFGAPGTNIDAPGSFGRITSASDGRIIQFALKYIF